MYESKEEGINILEHKYVWFRKWLDNIARIRGLESTVTVEQILSMLNFLDKAEMKMDEIIIEALGVK